MEIYKTIAGFEGLYEISNYGNVKSLSNNKSKKEKLLKQRLSNCGYKIVCLSKNNKYKTYTVHRLLANAFIDKLVFKKSAEIRELKDYPIDGTYGKILKSSPKSYDDVRDLVIADYQDEMEKQWIKELKKKYLVFINREVLETVNTHNK